MLSGKGRAKPSSVLRQVTTPELQRFTDFHALSSACEESDEVMEWQPLPGYDIQQTGLPTLAPADSDQRARQQADQLKWWYEEGAALSSTLPPPRVGAAVTRPTGEECSCCAVLLQEVGRLREELAVCRVTQGPHACEAAATMTQLSFHPSTEMGILLTATSCNGFHPMAMMQGATGESGHLSSAAEAMLIETGGTLDDAGGGHLRQVIAGFGGEEDEVLIEPFKFKAAGKKRSKGKKKKSQALARRSCIAQQGMDYAVAKPVPDGAGDEGDDMNEEEGEPEACATASTLEDEGRAFGSIDAPPSPPRPMQSDDEDGGVDFHYKLAELRAQFEELCCKMKKLEAEKEELEDDVANKAKDGNELRSQLFTMLNNIGFTSEKDIDNRIATLEFQFGSKSFPLIDEKMLRAEIRQLKLNRPKISHLQKMEAALCSFDPGLLMKERTDAINEELAQYLEAKQVVQEVMSELTKSRHEQLGDLPDPV